MVIWSLVITLFIGKLIKGESSITLSDGAGGTNGAEKPDTLVKAKFNFTTNGSFSGEFGKFANGPGDVAVETISNRKAQAFVDPNREMLKELISNLLHNPKLGNKCAKRFSSEDLVAFKPKLDSKFIPIKVPSVFDHTDKCMYKGAFCWCKEEPITVACTWETDCFCETTVTCGPTKPCPEHRDKWCFIKTPDVMAGRTFVPCRKGTTVPVCVTTGHTPCATFTPPCVHPTPHTIEPCVCPTGGPCTCPCPPAFHGSDLFSLLFKRAAHLPDPLKNRTINLLNKHLRKRSLKQRKQMKNGVSFVRLVK